MAKRMLLPGSCLISVGMCLCFLFLSWNSKPGDVICLPSAIDFGKVDQNQVLTGSFRLVNETPHPVRILRVYESCSCAGVAIDKPKISPGDRAEVKIRWNTRNGRGRSRVQVHVEYEQAGHSRFRALEMYGTIEPDFDFGPRELVFEKDKKGSIRLHLTPRKLDALCIEKAVVHSRVLSARTLDPRSVLVEYHPVPGDKGGLRDALLTVWTNSPREPRLELSITFLDSGEPK